LDPIGSIEIPGKKNRSSFWGNIAKYFGKKKVFGFWPLLFFNKFLRNTLFSMFYPTSSHRLGTASPTNINRALPNRAINWAMGQRAASNTCQGKSTFFMERKLKIFRK